MAEKWYNISAEDVTEKLTCDPHIGLDEKSVRARRDKYGRNDVFITERADLIACLKAVGGDFSFYLLTVLAILAEIFNEKVSAAVIVALIIINLILTLLTYMKSRRILRTMSNHAAPMSRVVRDGRLKAVRQSELVIGDIVILSEGDIVPADARILDANVLFVDESALTGEASPKQKTADIVYGANVPYTAQTNMVFATSTVVNGTARVVLCACGSSTVAAMENKRPEIVPHDDLRVLKRLKKVCSIWSLIMLLFIFAITAADIAFGAETRGLFNIFITAASVACAAMTEFYVIFAYFIIASGLFDLLKKKGSVNSGAVVKNISSLEVVESLDTFIVPKMGGFFAERAAIESIYAGDTHHRADEKNLYNSCGRTLKYGLLATGYAADAGVLDDPASEAGAIVSLAERIGIDRMVLMTDYPLLCSESSYDGMTADCAVVAADEKYIAVMRGEAAPMLERCMFYTDADNAVWEIDERERKYINNALRAIDENDCRAVAVVYQNIDGITLEDTEQNGWILAGVIGIREPSLAEAEKNIAACKDAGISVIVTAELERDPSRVYFKRLGLIENDDEIAVSTQIDAMSDDEWRAELNTFKMYEALTVDQKRTLIRLLHEEGRTVGVLGRRLSDLHIISDADVGFATGVTLTERASSLDMGERAAQRDEVSEVLKSACDVLVSTPQTSRGGFNAMVRTLCAAKNIYQNLLRMLKYLLTSQIARLAVVLFSVIVHNVWGAFAGLEFLAPAQILFLGLIIDFGVVCAIAFQRPPKNILTEKENTEERLGKPFIQNFIKPLILGLVWGISAIAAVLALTLTGTELSGEPLKSLMFISFILTQLITACEMIYETSLFARGHRVNRLLAVMWIGAVVFIAVGVLVPSFGVRFGLTMLTPFEWLGALIIPVVTLAAYELYKRFKIK